MGIYRGPGGVGDAVNDASSEAVITVTARDEAVAARNAAVVAKTAAELAETNAELAEVGAEAALAAAQGVATDLSDDIAAALAAQAAAQAAATAAATSATNASNSATAASGSASTATTQATNASTSASTATTQATNAASSASAASTSATNAASSASSASTSATNASNSATSASGSASGAATSASNASTSATNASASATSASGSASTATTQAGIATTQATNASSSASAASTSASAASTSATNAASSATAASGSASTASTQASNAATSATNAANSATAAAASATAAAAVIPTQTGNNGKYLKTDGTSTSWDALDISTADVSGTLPIANGGTNSTATPTLGGAVYGTGSAYAITAAGTAGQILTSNGGAAPTWQAAPVSLPSQTGNTGKYLTTDGSTASWDALATVANSGSYNDLIDQPTLTTNLDSLTDVTITSPTTDQVLKYNGSGWVNGAGATGGGFPSGTSMLFVQTAAPTGWTKVTTHNDKALRVVSGTASTGGSVAFTTAFASGSTGAYTLATSQIPAHSHLLDLAGGPGSPAANFYADTWGGASSIVPQLTSQSTGGGGSHSHSLSLAVQYVDVIIATKD